MSRGGDRAGRRGEREPGQSEGKEVQGGMKEVGSTRTPRQREPPRDEVRVPGPKNRSPGRRAGCTILFYTYLPKGTPINGLILKHISER